jgi:hypothetical protein
MNRQTATRSTLSLIALALLPLFAHAASEPAAGNGIESNGPYLQGVVLNGPILQGVVLNGPVLQGTGFNGPMIQGTLNQTLQARSGSNGPTARDLSSGEAPAGYGRGEGVRPQRVPAAAAGHSPMSGLATAQVVVHLPAR